MKSARAWECFLEMGRRERGLCWDRMVFCPVQGSCHGNGSSLCCSMKGWWEQEPVSPMTPRTEMAVGALDMEDAPKGTDSAYSLIQGIKCHSRLADDS